MFLIFLGGQEKILAVCFLIFCQLRKIRGAPQTLIEIEEKVADPAPSEVYYDLLLLKFDPECSKHAGYNLADHFREKLTAGQDEEKSVLEASAFRSFQSVRSGAGTNRIESHNIDPSKFANLLQRELLNTVDVLDISPKTSRKRALFETGSFIKLGNLPRPQREEEILSSLYLLGATKLVGEDRVPDLIKIAKSGTMADWTGFIQAHGEPRLIAQSQAFHPKANNEKFFQAEDSKHEAPPRQMPSMMQLESLEAMDIRIIKNPILQRELLDLANLLPCIAFEVEPDRSKNSLSELNMGNVTRRTMSSLNDDSGQIWDVELLEKDTNCSSDSASKKFLGNASPAMSGKLSYTLKVPNDAHFQDQWYLKGSTQSERYGSHVVDGWSYILKQMNSDPDGFSVDSLSGRINLEFAKLKDTPLGMTVAVLDSGCSKNPDLTNQFWRNPDIPGCLEGDLPAEGLQENRNVAQDCIGYDFGNDQPDPTMEVEGKIHGSSTSGLIAAETNNKIGIAGICPHCKIMCLKIYDSDKGKITMNSVVRALDYIARKKVKLSNHSYGGFGASNIEFAAHKTLSDLGHLSICSSGNNGCNIDVDTKDPQACKSSDGASMGPFTPASYKVDNIMSVGGTTKTGELASFSNYGSNSVDVFAPGDAIVTIYGKDHLASVRGTSFSSPIVTGLAATLWSFRPELTATEVKSLLVKTGTSSQSLTGKAKEGRIVSLSHALAGKPPPDWPERNELRASWPLLPVCFFLLLVNMIEVFIP